MPWESDFKTLTALRAGGLAARKRIPPDVREEYTRLYPDRGAGWEERLRLAPMSATLAKAKWREWSSEIEQRIENIRAARRGEGRGLTPKEARALSGEWYAWWSAIMGAAKWPLSVWEDYQNRMLDGLHNATTAATALSGDVLDHLARDDGMKAHCRPMIADEAKTAQFLAAKSLTLDAASRDLFLDCVAVDFFAAVALMVRRARGDFTEDDYAKQFPASGAADTSLTPWNLFEKWIAEAKPATSTVDRWRAVFLKLQADFPSTPAAALTPEQAQKWSKGLITKERTERTARDVWVIASRTIWSWAIGEKLVTRNPFTGWKLTVPRPTSTRESKAFTTDEANTILSSAAAIVVRSKMDAAKRWVPFIAAYTGARAGEITQLRGTDVAVIDGIPAIKITPEAGSTKLGTTRTVPIHEHLVEMGFMQFAKAAGKAPLFYNVAKAKAKPDDVDPTNPKRPRAVKARERLAQWVRELGIRDPRIRPNHAWRHSFKEIGHQAHMGERVIDAICGHQQATVGRGYGLPKLPEKAAELAKFPRYKCH
jgi:integrase